MPHLRRAGLPPCRRLPIQYADFAVWQRDWLQGNALSEQLAWWKRRLADMPVQLALPTDRPRPATLTYQAADLVFRLSPETVAGLNAVGQSCGATLFMTLLAAFQVLLGRYSGQDDVLVGSPIANRTRLEQESLIGFFVNTLVLRADLSGNPSFEELLKKVRETTLDTYANQDLPFERLVEELQPERHLNVNPLVQVVFALQNAPQETMALPGLSVSTLPPAAPFVRMDMEVHLFETGGGLEGHWVYATDLFEAATIERMAGHFQTLLGDIAAHPTKPIQKLAMLSEAELRQVLRDWNATEADYPKDQCVHQLVEAQAERTPEAIALVFEEQSLSYAELNARANQLAHHLITLGVQPDDRVAIGVERSLEMVVGMLAILKAGGAYVPLGSGLSRGAVGVHAGRQRTCGAAGAWGDAGAPGRPGGWSAAGGSGQRCGGLGGTRHRQPGAGRSGPEAGSSGLCDLHLGLHRQAQGGDGGAPRRVQLGDGANSGVRPWS